MRYLNLNLIFVSVFVCVSALAVPLKSRDVVAPAITDPKASTVWTVGSTQQVLWDTSKLPPYPNITNPVGQVILGFLDGNGENLMLDNPLAKGFNITQGSVQVVVPSVPYRTNYIVVLMGDSGNASPTFTITGGSSGTSPNPTKTPPAGVETPSSSASSSSTTDTGTPLSPNTPGFDTTASGSSSTLIVNTTMTTVVPPSSSSTSVVVVQTNSPSTSSKTNGAISARCAGATWWSVAAVILGGLLL